MKRYSYTYEEKKDLIQIMEDARDVNEGLDKLIEKYTSTPMAMKISLLIAHKPLYTQDWFNESATSKQKRLTSKELIQRIFNELDSSGFWSGTNKQGFDRMDRKVLEQAIKSDFPHNLLLHIYRKIVWDNIYFYLRNERAALEQWLETPLYLNEKWNQIFKPFQLKVKYSQKDHSKEWLNSRTKEIDDYIKDIPDYILLPDIKEPKD